jgi:hypothetical protein
MPSCEDVATKHYSSEHLGLGVSPLGLILSDLAGLSQPRRALDPDEVLDAVARMDQGQRARLAELLGVEHRHRTLYLPRAGGGFARPLIAIQPSRSLQVDRI